MVVVFETLSDLEKKLQDHGIDTSKFGQGSAKSVEALYNDIQADQTCALETDSKGSLKRVVSLVKIPLIAQDTSGTWYQLISNKQFLPDGRQRQRRDELARMIKPGEVWQECLTEVIADQLKLKENVVQRQIRFDFQGYKYTENEVLSPGYPGLVTLYRIHEIPAQLRSSNDPELKCIGLPEGHTFSVIEGAFQETNIGARLRIWTWERCDPPEPKQQLRTLGAPRLASKQVEAEMNVTNETTAFSDAGEKVCPVTGFRGSEGDDKLRACPGSDHEVGMCPMGFGRAARGGGHIQPAPQEFDYKSQADTLAKAPSLEVLLSSPGENLDGFLSADFGLCPKSPIQSLPEDGPHVIWEHVASKLAEMYASGDYSQLKKLPEIDATPRFLPDEQLKRAAMLLGIMAHSWAQVGPGGELPPGVLIPWECVNRRMGRPAATMTYQDYFTQNLCWRKDLAIAPPYFTDDNVYEDTDVSIKAFGIDNELFFIQYNFGMDWFSRGMPLDMAKAQQAVLNQDDATLEEMLMKIIYHVESMTQAFTAIDPHPFSAKYCCPIEWSKTIGRLIPSIRKGEQSLSGLQNSSIHLVDIFLGRTTYDSDMGQLAIEERQGWLPSLHLQFFQALSKISVRAYICRHANRRLRRLYNRLLDSWTGPGEHSFMSKHRIKINNFLELGMKTAREKSSGVSAGEGSDWGNSRAWETVDRYCMEAARERFDELCINESWFTPVFLRRVEDMPSETSRIVFDVAGSGLSFEPGDRVKIQPVNSPEHVLRCLAALQCTATHKIPLSDEWLQFVARIGLHDHLELQMLPLHDFLLHATIRPMTSTMARALMMYTCVDNSHLLAQVNSAGGLSGFEFWDFLLLCSSLNPRHTPIDLVPVLAFILMPMEPRQYSISSSAVPGASSNARTLEIMVGQLCYSERDDLSLVPFETEDVSTPGGAQKASLISDQVESSDIAAGNFGLDFSLKELNDKLLELMPDAGSGGQAVRGLDPCSPIRLVSPTKAMNPFNQARQRALREAAMHRAVQRGSLNNCSISSDEDHAKFVQAHLNLRAHPAFTGTIGCPERLRTSSKEMTAQTDRTPLQFGVCSTYLRHFAIGRSVQAQVEHAEHFHMPCDSTVPIVMFGLGTGAAPFRSFVHSGGGTRELWLFWGIRSTKDLFDWDEWAMYVSRGELNLRLALSQDFEPLQSHQWPDRPTESEAKRRWHELTAGAENPGRLDKLLKQSTVQQSLANLMRRGAVFYCCGQPALGGVVESGLVSALQSTGLSEIDAQQQFFKLIGDHRFKLDLFSSRLLEGQGQLHGRPISRAEVARHCCPNDCWVIINQKVCDLSKYLLQHPGGPKILLDKAGRDCTQDFDRAHGLHNNRVLGMLSPFFIGPLQAPTTPQDSLNRTVIIDVVSDLVDRLLEAYNVLQADWNRYPELCLPSGPSTSFHRNKETHRRFAGTTLKVMMRALQSSLNSIPGGCEDEAVAFSALENAQQALAMIDLPDQQTLALAIQGDFAFAAKARDGAIAVLEDVEASDLEPAEVTQRIGALIEDLGNTLGNLVQSFFLGDTLGDLVD
eukprot:gnl/MRDRNA2_/MRDRNA2_30098_c0_seq1.p1 gnl/MRDRNA2_/MRDRNA2_30098_c0~~gnl/MRDRNA2_/MRDRNA2_30098_c0_seq1.p1  ORF type:complete len:1555 (-),score=280.63 gnl/MRDRNA2_/MRDRNA2_30098_c0_seq1:277-4941(-)